MRPAGLLLAAVAGVLAAAPAWAGGAAQRAAQVPPDKAPPREAKAVASRHNQVKRLEKDVAAQEASSHAASQRLQRQDAEIAELKRQLQQLQQPHPAPAKSS